MENEFIYSEEFQSYGDNLKNGITDYVTVESSLLDGTSIEIKDKATPMGCMQEFLDASLVGDKDTAMKKLFAAGLTLANDAGVLPFDLLDDSPAGVASLVDDGLTRVKVAYKVAIGEIPLEEAADTLIDAAAARITAIADAFIDTVEANTDLICDALSVAFPPATELIQLFKPTIKHVVINVAPKVKEAIHSGIEKVSHIAKETIKPIIAKAREIGIAIKNHFLNIIIA